MPDDVNNNLIVSVKHSTLPEATWRLEFRRRQGRWVGENPGQRLSHCNQPAANIKRVSSAVVSNPPADRFMRRVLRVDTANKRGAVGDARSFMSKSILISAVRCLLTYLIIPLAGPTVGVVGSVGRPIGALLCIAGVYTSTRSMRKFWVANHKYRWYYTVFATVILVYLTVSLIADAVYYL